VANPCAMRTFNGPLPPARSPACPPARPPYRTGSSLWTTTGNNVVPSNGADWYRAGDVATGFVAHDQGIALGTKLNNNPYDTGASSGTRLSWPITGTHTGYRCGTSTSTGNARYILSGPCSC
jgi:hypothetical protein